MKRLFVVAAVAIGIALSVGAQQQQQQQQQQPTDEQQMPVQKGKKAKVEESTGVQENVSTGTAKEKGQVKAGVSSKEGGTVSQSTTVFRNGQQTNERLSLHRSTRERTDTHFSIGTHDRGWWLRTYSIVLLDGCHYYLADNGCWYPAYGFDPACDYPPGVVYCD